MKTITATTKGIAINYQDTGKSSFIPYEKELYNNQSSDNNGKYRELNPMQRSMFCRLMYGIKNYNHDELSSMSESLIFTIKKEHYRATDVLNQLKYERYYGAYNKLLKTIFPQIELNYFKDGKYAEMPTLKELKITTDDIIKVWIDNKLLPLNFYSIQADELSL